MTNTNKSKSGDFNFTEKINLTTKGLYLFKIDAAANRVTRIYSVLKSDPISVGFKLNLIPVNNGIV